MAAETARANVDLLWQASAMEGLCCAVAILANAADTSDLGPLPSLASFMGSSGISLGDYSVTGSTAQLKAFARDIPQQYLELMTLYEKSRVWPLVYIEACLKMARFIANSTDKALQLRRIELTCQWISRGWAFSHSSLSVTEQIHVATAAAEISGLAGAIRKRAFWLRRVTALVFPVLKQETDDGLEPDLALQKRVLSCLSRICPAYGIERLCLSLSFH